jgi:hypothetical protein
VNRERKICLAIVVAMVAFVLVVAWQHRPTLADLSAWQAAGTASPEVREGWVRQDEAERREKILRRAYDECRNEKVTNSSILRCVKSKTM